MNPKDILQEIRTALEGRPGQPIVLGVCRTLARRWGHETWKVRLVAMVLALLWTLPAVAAYVIAGFALAETEPRTRGFFAGLAVLMRETAQKIFAALGRLFEAGAGGPHRHSGC